MVEGVGPVHRPHKLKEVKSSYENKKELSPREFLDFLDSYAKPSKATGIRRLGLGSRTEREESDLISMARKTKTINSGNVSITPIQQTCIAEAINFARFGNPTIPPLVAEKIAENLGAFTDPKAQREVAEAIDKGRFGNPIPESVAEKIAENLGAFTDSEAQRDVAWAINSGRFGNPTIPPLVAEKIAENLGAFKDHPRVQIMVAVAIKDGRFGNPTIPQSVAEKIAENLGAFTDPLAQIAVALAIGNRLFGDPTIPLLVAVKIAENLGVFTDPEAQLNVAWAISDGRFGNPIPRIVSEKLISTMFLDSFRLIHYNLTNSVSDSLDLKYNRLVLSGQTPDISDEILKIHITAPLGHYVIKVDDDSRNLETVVAQKIEDLLGVEEYVVQDLLNDGTYTMTVYEKEGKKFLLTYKFTIKGDGTIDSEQFKGWLSENPMFYKSTVSDVKIYEISGVFPNRVEIKDENYPDFGKLPRFMQSAIKDASFDSSKYTHEDELEFIFGEVGLLETLKTTGEESDEKTDLINKMKSIIQTCIVQEGGSVRISSDREEDKAIKDGINELYVHMEQWDPTYEPKLNAFLEGKDDQTKAKLAFLFGQLAKAGVLGYHHATEDTNKGNTLFTVLSCHCYARLSNDFKTNHGLMIYNEEEQKYMDPLDVLYTTGSCIEVTAHTLMIECGKKNLNLQSIWEKDV